MHGGSDQLSALAVRVFLKQAVLDDELLGRLADARGRPWVVIRDALLELRDAGEVGGCSG